MLFFNTSPFQRLSWCWNFSVLRQTEIYEFLNWFVRLLFFFVPVLRSFGRHVKAALKTEAGGGERRSTVQFQNFHWHCIIKRYWVEYRADWPSDKTFVSALSVETRAEAEAWTRERKGDMTNFLRTCLLKMLVNSYYKPYITVIRWFANTVSCYSSAGAGWFPELSVAD